MDPDLVPKIKADGAPLSLLKAGLKHSSTCRYYCDNFLPTVVNHDEDQDYSNLPVEHEKLP